MCVDVFKSQRERMEKEKKNEMKYDIMFFKLACASLAREDFADQETLNREIEKRIPMLYAAYTEWKKKQPCQLRDGLMKACDSE